jgi:hypothetical protein
MRHLLSSPKFCDAAKVAATRLDLAQYVVIDGYGDIVGETWDWEEAHELAIENAAVIVFSVEGKTKLLPVILTLVE